MKLRVLASAALMLSAIALPAQADLVETDWKVAGDSKVTLHEETGIEWLDLSVTDGMSMSQFASAMDPAAMITSGQFEGFRIPTAEEVYHFMMAVTDYTYVNDFPTPGARVTKSYSESSDPVHRANYDNAKRLLGETRPGAYVSGYHLPYNHPQQNASGRTAIQLGGGNVMMKMADYSYSGFFNDQDYTGVFLVSDGGYTLSSINDPSINQMNPNAPVNQASNVPVAASGLLALLGIGASAARRKKTTR